MTDLANDYLEKRYMGNQLRNEQEMLDFMNSDPDKPPMEISVTGGGENGETPVVPGKLQPRRDTTDDLGRHLPGSAPIQGWKPAGKPEDAGGERSTAGKVIDNVGEVLPGAAKGVHDAVYNATAFVDPLAQWLDENVANLGSYEMADQTTPTGKISKSAAQFLTGFVPAVKALRAAGVTNGAANATAAGAIADFATRDGHEGRLMDLWKELGLPENDFTKWMETNEDGNELTERFKNALEGSAIGLAMDGVMMAARLTRDLIRSQRTLGPKTEEMVLKEKYGSLTDEEIAQYLGDPNKPMVETRVVPPPALGVKVPKAEGTLPNFDPRALIRTTKKTTVEEPLAGHKSTDLGDVILTESAKQPGKFQVTFWDGKAGVSKTTQDMVFDTREEAIKAFDGAGPGKVLKQSWGGTPQIKSEDFETYVNFTRFDEPDQVKFTIGKMAEAMKGQVDEARRGVITQKETEKMADDLGMTVAELMERRKGQPFNAEEALAARQLWAASGEKLLEAAKLAASPNAGDLDQFVFRRAMAIHSAIQNEVIGARTETARALAAWKIPVGGNIEKARAIQQVMDAAGGPQHTKEMARRLAILAEVGANPADIARFVARGWDAKTADIVKEVWVNGLLSSPKTHVVNITSNTGVAFQQIYERAVAGGIRSLVGGDGVKASESIAMSYGLVSGIRDAFRMAAKSLKTGETGYAFNKVEVSHPKSISAEAFKMSSETGLGRFLDFTGHAFTVPGRLLGAEDEFFKTIGYRMEIHAQSLRQATQEGLSGKEAWERMRQLVDSPPDHIRINAADAAMYNTFTSEVGWVGKSLMGLRDNGSPGAQVAMTFVLPFVRTPTNIARYTFERTPFAPLVGQWRADIAAGGARADLALARMSTGTAIMVTAMDWATGGAVSGAGPKDPAEREALLRSGWQPYSIRVGDRWYSYNRTDPFGATMGFAASIAEAVGQGEVDQEDVDEWNEVMAMSIAAVSQVVINKTYLEGIANIVEVMSDAKRYSESYVTDLVASFVPFTSLSNAVKGAADPTMRETNSPWEAVQARIAGASEKLPPRRDLWGQPIKTESGLGKVYDFMSPVASRQQDIDPVDREIVRLGQGPQRVKKKTVFDGVEVSLKRFPDVYDEYTRLAGNDLKHPAWGMGAKDYLNAVVSGKHPMSAAYGILSDENQRQFIENTVRSYRKLAQQEILANPKFANFAAEIEYIKSVQQQAKQPVFGE
jgi:hypothetical protein